MVLERAVDSQTDNVELDVGEAPDDEAPGIRSRLARAAIVALFDVVGSSGWCRITDHVDL